MRTTTIYILQTNVGLESDAQVSGKDKTHKESRVTPPDLTWTQQKGQLYHVETSYGPISYYVSVLFRKKRIVFTRIWTYGDL